VEHRCLTRSWCEIDLKKREPAVGTGQAHRAPRGFSSWICRAPVVETTARPRTAHFLAASGTPMSTVPPSAGITFFAMPVCLLAAIFARSRATRRDYPRVFRRPRTRPFACGSGAPYNERRSEPSIIQPAADSARNALVRFVVRHQGRNGPNTSTRITISARRVRAVPSSIVPARRNLAGSASTAGLPCCVPVEDVPAWVRN